MTRPLHKAAPAEARLNHVDGPREVLHRAVDRVFDAWPLIDRMSRDMGRGFPSSTIATGGSGGAGMSIDNSGDDDDDRGPLKGTVVELTVLRGGKDPAKQAEDWLEDLERLQNLAAELDSTRVKLLPLTPAQRDKLKERPNSVEVCADCGQPTIKVKRIDGAPYCATSCYVRNWRSRAS